MKPSTSSRLFAFLAYLLPVIGWLIAFLFRRQDKLAMYHTKQSITLFIAAIAFPLAWAIVGYLLSFIPYIGFMMAVILFALVIVAEITFIIIWIMGMVYALQGKVSPLPIVGAWASRWAETE